MPDIKTNTHGQRAPPSTSATGHPLPRRASPENSVTLRNHRLARDASLKAAHSIRAPSSVAHTNPLSSRRRESSGASHDNGQSESRTWFEQSNEKPTALFSQSMDVDPPFFQKETDSSNEDLSKDSVFPYHLRAGAPLALKPTVTRSSSSGDYRSVIDDLTIEIQRLKEELKRYKQEGPDMLKREKLFEIKVHGLPKRKKRELEEKLRDFAANLEETPSAETSSARKKSSRHTDRMYSASGSMSKHASSSSGSNSRPADSAYASMSTGRQSSGASLGGPSMSSRARSSEHKVQNYLKEIPEGLYPRHVVITEKEKKKMIVRRLEQLFTGKITGRSLNRNQSIPPAGTGIGPVIADPKTGTATATHQLPSLLPDATREARILATDGGSKKTRSRDNASTSQSNGDQTESGGNGVGLGDAITSPPNATLPEQRPTRPRDLDPDRVQVPSENMEYIRHLGLVAPELLQASLPSQDVAPDADGWVYLNLLSNLAQLHMMNVAPDFIRQAVSEKSTKFQVSPDGRKIRWRGGSDGTKFSSDSSGDNSMQSPSADDTDGSNKDGQRKKSKTQQSATGLASTKPSEKPWKLGPQVSGSSESFHYKPLFVRQSSSYEQTSQDDTGSSLGVGDESNMGGESRWGMSGSGSSQRRKRRLDGAIIYYSGAPFCTDLSGDTGETSPATYMASTEQQKSVLVEFVRPELPFRTHSGSYLSFRPLSDPNLELQQSIEVDFAKVDTNKPDDAVDLQADFPWSDSKQVIEGIQLEPCGLGGVLPDDHFMVAVITRRRKEDGSMAELSHVHRRKFDEGTDAVIRRLASTSTSSPRALPSIPRSRSTSPAVGIDYVSGRVKRLAPVPLPPPTLFFPPFSTDSSGTSEEDSGSDADDDMQLSQDSQSRRPNPHYSNAASYPDGVDMSSGDEEGDEPDDEDESEDDHSEVKDMEMQIPRDSRMRRSSSSAVAAAGTGTGRSKSTSADPMRAEADSSVATAGDRDAESGYSSSIEGSG